MNYKNIGAANMNTKKSFCAVALSVAFGASSFPVMSATVEMIVPFSAGGGTDTVARVFAPAFGKELDETVIIRNLAGASGTIGAAAAADARPDGLTIGYLPIGPVAIQPSLRDTSYTLEDYDYVCQTTDTPVFLLVSSDSDLASVDDVIASGQSGRVIYGSSGPGTIPHLAMAAFASATDVNAVHLPFEGTGVAMNAMAGGEIQLFADTATVLESNNVKALAVFGEERLEAYPDIPTLKELGHDMQFSVWQGLFAPKGLPQETLDQYATACEKAVQYENFQKHLQNTHTGFAYRGPEAFEEFVRRSAATNADILKEAGLVE